MSPNHAEDTHNEPPLSELQSAPLAQLHALESVRAPDSLHSTIERMVGDAAAHSRRRRFARGGRFALPRAQASRSFHDTSSLRPRLLAAGALLAAAAAVLVAIVLGSGGQSAPTVLEASRVALAPATQPSPAENPHEPGRLDASVEGLTYPYWGGRRGWPAAGARQDQLGGRAVTTVFYVSRSGARIGYTIVAGRALAEPRAGTVLATGGERFRVLRSSGANIVTWRAAGHTCILAARGVPARAMVRLALS